MSKKENFIEILKKWKKRAWHQFASNEIRGDTKQFWCNKNGDYKVVLKSKTVAVYYGNDMEEACRIYETL